MGRWGIDSWYQSTLAMDETIGRHRAMQPQVEGPRPPLSPYGYSLPVLLQLKQIDLLKEVIRVVPAAFSGKLPPPFPPEPRPQTAEQRIRDELDTLNVHSVLQQMGVRI